MMKPSVISLTLLGMVLSTALAGPDAIDPHDPPEGRFSDEWAEVYIAGEKVGYSHSTMARDGNLIRTSATVFLRITRANQPITLRSEEGTTETVAGAPVGFESTMKMSMMQAATKGEIKDGKVTVVQSQFGMEQTREFEYPAGALMSWGSFRESLLRGFKAGTQYALRLYMPQLRLDDAVIGTTTVGEMDEYQHAGKRLRGRKVVTVVESPMGKMEMTSWVDESGRPLKAIVPAPGVGNLEIVTTDQATALTDFVPPELFTTTIIEAKRTIPRSAHRVKYRITAKNDEVDLSELPETGMQKISARTDRSVELVVMRQDHTPVDPRKAEKLPPGMGDYLDSNLMINLEDPDLVKLAKRAAGGETEPFALGDKLRRFVTGYVSDKNLDVGFATASEVSRTKEGDCSEHGVLLAALGRLNGLPSRVVAGVAYLPTFGGRRNVFGYHMWTEFFIDGRWVDFDAALGESECSPTRIAFATSSLKNTGMADLSLPLLSKIGGIDVEILEIDSSPTRH